MVDNELLILLKKYKKVDPKLDCGVASMAKIGLNFLELIEGPKFFIKEKFLYKDEEEILKRINIDSLKLDHDFTFAIVIPMYNEYANAYRCVLTLENYLQQLPLTSKIIVVDDASTDGTGEVLENMLKKFPRLILRRHKANAGYGGANVTGIQVAIDESIKYVLFMDADLTQNVNYITSFLPHMQNGVDYIKATRYSEGGGVYGVPFRRWAVSFIGNLLARKILKLKLTDYTNGFRAAKTELFRDLTFEERGFPYLIEEVIKVNAIAKSFANVPYILTVREGGESKFTYSHKIYFKYLKWLFKH